MSDDWSSLDIRECVELAVQEADVILACHGGAKVLAWIADLPHHIYGAGDQATAKRQPRPEGVLRWDRKALSHLPFFVQVGVPLDTGNLVLFCGLLVLLRRTGAVTRGGEVVSLCSTCYQRSVKCLERLRQMGGEILEPPLFIGLVFVQLLTVETKLQPMEQLNRSRMEYAGDILAAWGAVCHPWNLHARLLQQHLLNQLSLSEEQLLEFWHALGRFMQRLKPLVAKGWCL